MIKQNESDEKRSLIDQRTFTELLPQRTNSIVVRSLQLLAATQGSLTITKLRI
jgi:hypothetical protein